MTSEVEQRIHSALSSHALERTVDGYRLVHPSGRGVSTLRLVTVEAGEGLRVEAIAHIEAEYNAADIPALPADAVERLNAMAVYGAYRLENGTLRQTAQFSIHAQEPAVHLLVQTILNAFGAQLPLGLSVVLATRSAAALEQQRAHHAMPRQWSTALTEESLAATTKLLHERGLAAANNLTAVWAELPLSGDCPSRAVDPQAETALLHVDTRVAHPIAGAGYLATISLPLADASVDAAQICRQLNARERNMVDFVPRLGAWGLHGPNGVPGYSCFIPCPEPYGEIHTTLIWWSAIRAAWLRDRCWVAKRGVSLDARPLEQSAEAIPRSP